MECSNTSCKWRHKGECVLFKGQTVLECKYRITKKAKPAKEGKKKNG